MNYQESHQSSEGRQPQSVDGPEEVMLGSSVDPLAGMARFSDGSDVLLGTAHTNQLSFEENIGAADPAMIASKTPEERFSHLRKVTSEYLTPEEGALLTHAFEYARDAHAGQCRKSGEPFVSHPVEVAIILGDLRMDIETLCAALLHDVVEDTPVTSKQLAKEFGPAVGALVDGVTKISRIEVENLSDEQAQTIRRMFVAMNKDIRTIVVKLADRLHNMRTLQALPEDRRIFKARETMEIYAPIAHRLGIGSIKWELEDLAFFYLEPLKFKQISRMVAESRAEREEYLGKVIVVLREEMNRIGIDGTIMGRPKHLYSIYRKMTEREKDFSEIYDLIAVRIIVDTVAQCYSALGAVHSLWHPMPGRFKDYIAMPKYNMYQSLHTTVIGPAARPLEVQIRTVEMHHMSEYGVAAHWRYKEGGGRGDEQFDQQLAWLRQMVDWQDETQDNREFLKNLKVDLAPTEVFVFTPKGDAKSMRAGSTPIDFAYAIHTEVGNHCVGAKVNGAIVPLSYELQMGDRVEILTQKSATPSRDWMNMVKTPSARSKIRSYFARATRADDIQEGHERLTHELRKEGLGISSAAGQRALRNVATHLGFKDVDDMLAAVGTGKESTQGVAQRILAVLRPKEEPAKPEITLESVMTTGKVPPMTTSVRHPKTHKHKKASNGVIVQGEGGMLVRLSRCCNPVPGDPIVGFVTRGRGVSVHRRDCPNAVELLKRPERIIPVEWEDESKNSLFKVEVGLEAIDHMGLLGEAAAILSEAGANVLTSSTSVHRDGTVEMRFLFEVHSASAFDTILKRLNAIDGVLDAHRLVPGEKG